MNPHIWKKSWSPLLKEKAIEVAKTPKLYLKLTTRCMEQVNRLCSAHALQFMLNKHQCLYLANKLQNAIQSANSIIKDVNKEFLSLAHHEEMEQLLKIFKLLNAMGVEVEGFIQICCKETWVQSAIILMGTLEWVATIGLNLEFCSNIFFARQSQRRTALLHFDATRILKVEVLIVKDFSCIDRMNLISNLKNVIESNASSNAKWQLATFLLQRLETTMLLQDMNSSRSVGRIFPLMIKNLQQMPDCLGKGAFAIVHKAIWFGIEVAKKTFYVPTSADFLREVSILDGLNHPNIVSLLGSMTDGKRSHLVMELMDGDLFSWMHQRMEENGNQGSPFNIQEALDLILQIGEGMLYLHEKRIVHRDLKSHNILIRCGKVAQGNVKYLQVKVADFGLSRTKERSATFSDMSLNVGTTRWMAPEMMRVGYVQSDDVDEHEVALNYPFKIDIYSFGMVCYEILTEEVPFSNLSHGEVKKRVLSGERPPLPRECPYRLRTLIESCWNAEASVRPSFDNLCEELRDLKYSNFQIYWKAKIYRCPLEDIMTIDELVAKLSSPIAEVQHMVADGIHLMVNRSLDHRIYIKEQGAMLLLVALYYSGNLKAREHAITTLQALSVVDRELTIQKDCVKELFPRRNPTFVGSVNKEIYLSSAVGPIVEVLKTGPLKARENAAEALMKLSSDLGIEVVEKIRNSGALLALMTLRRNGSAEGKEYASILLSRTLQVQPNLRFMSEDDASEISASITKVRESFMAFAAALLTSPRKSIAPESWWKKVIAALILQ